METEKKSVAFEARQMLRGATRAALATIDSVTGNPYVSLTAIATQPDGRPVTLISALARHTKNLAQNTAASLLIEQPAETGGVMAGARVTVTGPMSICSDLTSRNRYLARHPDARDFVDFSDFSFYHMDIQEAHFVAAFGRIHTISGRELLPSDPIVSELAEIEPTALRHMNDDHHDAIGDIAVKAGGAATENWQMIDLDREGFSIMSKHGYLRIVFPKPLDSSLDLRKSLTELAKQARISL